MKELIFIPYQDIYDFSSGKILTREYAMLKIVKEHEPFSELVCVGKPRTFLDKKLYSFENIFPQNSVEWEIKDLIDHSKHLRKECLMNMEMLFRKRSWWVNGYKKMTLDEKINGNNTLVYSNTPFAWKLIKKLKDKGALIVFDMMDNFSIHPSLNLQERKTAYEGYREIFQCADFISCNSVQSQKFCEQNFGIIPKLIKNGVFPQKLIKEISVYHSKLEEIKKKYIRVVGYVGKLGLRLDEELIKRVAEKCNDTAFVFVGPFLKGQKNKKLENIFQEMKNVIHLDAIPSSEVPVLLSEFDILAIPHSVGKNENGGDPLKLYQYLCTRLPIITTSILGVSEFSSCIYIADQAEEWIKFINEEYFKKYNNYKIPENIFWEYRAKSLIKFLEGEH